MTTRDNRRRRTLTVMIEGWIIEDGQVEPPKVGETLSAHLTFDRPSSGDSDDPRVGTLRAVAHPTVGEGPIIDRDGRPWWRTLLHGDGWSAHWTADRPMTGQVELTGVLRVDYEAHADAARGRVTRIRLATCLFRDAGPVRPVAREPVPGSVRYTDVDAAPRRFEREEDTGPEGGVRESQIGVLVDLDLDDVPLPELRPRIAAPVVSGQGSSLWFIDGELPVLVHLDCATGRASEHILPVSVLPPNQRRRVSADASGCWITGPDGILRCTRRPGGDLDVRAVDTSRVAESAASGGVLLAVESTRLGPRLDADSERLTPSRIPGQPARIVHPHGPPVPVTLPGGVIESVVATGTGFLVLLRTDVSDRGSFPFRIAAVTVDGRVRLGPPCTLDDEREYPTFVSSNPVLLHTQRALYRLRDDLRIVRSETLPQATWPTTGQAAGRVCLVTHNFGGVHSWPNDVVARTPPPTADRWLVVDFHPESLTPQRVFPVDHSHPSVAGTADGAVWIADSGLRRVGPEGSVAAIDVDELLG